MNSPINKAIRSTIDLDSESKGGKVIHKRVASKDPDTFKCACGKSFSHESSLYCHIKRETSRKSFTCPHCSKEFKSKLGWTLHLDNNICRRNSDSYNIEGNDSDIVNESKRGSKSSSNAQSGPPLMPLSIRGY